MTESTAAPVLLIAKEPIKAGSAEDYGRIEAQIAEVSARLRCPHPYLALERTTGSAETWWLNTFESFDHRDRVGQEYAANTPFMKELNRLAGQKKQFTGEVVSVYATYRSDLSHRPWSVTGVRHFAVRVLSGPEAGALVFEGDDDLFYSFTPARSDNEIPGFEIFAVKPVWSFPDNAWIDADPAFWKENPVARIRSVTPNR